MLKPVMPREVPEGDLLNLGQEDRADGDKSRSDGDRHASAPDTWRESKSEGTNQAEHSDDDDFEEEEWVPDVFLFEYGTVVIWGMTEREEKAFLRSLWVLCTIVCASG